MSKFCLGFTVAIGLVIGCGAVNNTASTSSKPKLSNRLVVVSEKTSLGGTGKGVFGNPVYLVVIKDTKTGTEFIVVWDSSGTPSIIQIVTRLRAII